MHSNQSLNVECTDSQRDPHLSKSWDWRFPPPVWDRRELCDASSKALAWTRPSAMSQDCRETEKVDPRRRLDQAYCIRQGNSRGKKRVDIFQHCSWIQLVHHQRLVWGMNWVSLEWKRVYNLPCRIHSRRRICICLDEEWLFWHLDHKQFSFPGRKYRGLNIPWQSADW